MIKIFTADNTGKINLTKEELKSLLDEAYWDGFRSGSHTTYTYATPTYTPYRWTTSGNSVTLSTATTATSNAASCATAASTRTL